MSPAAPGRHEDTFITDAALVKKLLIKPGMRLRLLNAPPDYRFRLEPLPDGATFADGGDLDFVQVFANNAADVDSLVPEAIKSVRRDGLLWICYLKGGKKAGTDLNRDLLWQRVEPMGVVGVTLVALDDKWSAMRFRPPDATVRGTKSR